MLSPRGVCSRISHLGVLPPIHALFSAHVFIRVLYHITVTICVLEPSRAFRSPILNPLCSLCSLWLNTPEFPYQCRRLLPQKQTFVTRKHQHPNQRTEDQKRHNCCHHNPEKRWDPAPSMESCPRQAPQGKVHRSEPQPT